jgi:hypothetical protein
METLAVRQVTPEQAAAAMRAAGLRAPVDCDTAEAIAAHGECFELEAEDGGGVFVVRRKGDVLWIDGAAATRPGNVTETGLALFMEIARQCGANEIAFETARPGLVRKSKKAGYRVAGFIMKKAVV